MLAPFHLAILVHDLEKARSFYADLLGCEVGRSADQWIDFSLYGHQLVAHLAPGHEGMKLHHNPVDGDKVPVPHFGVVLPMDAWSRLRATLLASDEVRWVIRPRVRFAGEAGEQATLFLLDPSGNALEFKAFADPSQLFAKPPG
jgi:extradiol dioxygenase family protein